MYNQVKVKETSMYMDAQGSHVVCEGKLALLYNEQYLPEIGMIGSNNVHPLFMWTQQHKDNLTKLIEYQKTKMVLPVIYSETEKIHPGDWCLLFDDFGNLFSDTPQQYTGADGQVLNNGLRKILVFPDSYSQKHLQVIIDGKMQDGDNVWVECGKVMPADDGTLDIPFYIQKDTYGQVKLFPYKQSYTKHELVAKLQETINEWCSPEDIKSPDYLERRNAWIAQML